MKAKKLELDVDVIGGQEPLTEEEEKALREFFRKQEVASKKTTDNKKMTTGKRAFRRSNGL